MLAKKPTAYIQINTIIKRKCCPLYTNRWHNYRKCQCLPSISGNIIWLLISTGERSIFPCNSPQYLELGRPGTINCDFGDDFLGVYWYNSTTLLDSDQIIYYSDYNKDGTGYLSGEFDILPNGTLIINNVSLHHEHVFTAVMFRTKVETTVPIYVMVIVTGKHIKAWGHKSLLPL